MQELANAIREHRLIQPVVVTPEGRAGFILPASEIRRQAAQIAELETMPATMHDRVDEQNQAENVLIENAQRAGLSAVDEARTYEDLAIRHSLSNEEIAQRVGKDRATIANLRGLLRLPAGVLDLIGDGEQQLSQGVARTLAQVAKFPKAHQDLEKLARRMVSGKVEREALADEMARMVEHYAREINLDWDIHWPHTPVEVADAQAALRVGACVNCPHFVTLRRRRYCAHEVDHCYSAKVQRYTQQELERVAQATRIPIAGPDERVSVLTIEWRHEARVTSWLKARQRPAHLRLVAAGEQRTTDTLRQLLHSDIVLLASTDAHALTRAVAVPAKTPSETPVQRAKREAAEEQARVECRAEKAQKRRAQHDIDWLGLHTARIIAPQITASGATLEWLARYVNQHSAIGAWPVMREREVAIDKLLEKTKGRERETLLKELILVHLIGNQIAASGAVDWHEDWGHALGNLTALMSGKAASLPIDGLGLKQPAGWDKPPVHKTAANCWHCGRFTSLNRLTDRDKKEGWGVSQRGKDVVDVYCPDCGSKLAQKKVGRGNRYDS